MGEVSRIIKKTEEDKNIDVLKKVFLLERKKNVETFESPESFISNVTRNLKTKIAEKVRKSLRLYKILNISSVLFTSRLLSYFCSYHIFAPFIFPTPLQLCQVLRRFVKPIIWRNDVRRALLSRKLQERDYKITMKTIKVTRCSEEHN